MNKEEKTTFVAEFRDKAARSSAMYLTDFTGLDVKAMTDLRSRLRAAGCEYVVVKNRLVKRALDDPGMEGLVEALAGPTGVIFTSNGVAEAARTVSDFAKEHDGKPSLKAGWLEGRALEAADVARIADLPSREALLSMLAGALEGPLAALASALEAKTREAAGLLEALRDKRNHEDEG